LAVITGLETDDHVVAGLSDAFASGTKFVAAAGHRSSTLAPERTTDNLGDELQRCDGGEPADVPVRGGGRA